MIKKIVLALLNRIYFRESSIRKIRFGPYKGLKFKLTPSLKSRKGIFYKYWEPNVSHSLKSNLLDDMTVFCIGSHVGIHVLYISTLVSKGKVYAFEPDPTNFLDLQNNVNLNNINNVICINKSVSDVTSSKTYFKLDESVSRGMGKISRVKSDNCISVESISIDDFIKSESVNPDLLLIDTEGHENAVLSGASKLIEDKFPKIIVEIHGDKQKVLCESFLTNFKYSLKALDSEHIFASRGITK